MNYQSINKSIKMNLPILIKKSLWFYRRTHFSVFLGTIVTTAILTGALIVGDSVRYSLKRIALLRLGNTEYAIISGDRFFRTELAREIGDDLNILTAPLLQLQGIAINNYNQRRVNKVRIVGVDENFWKIGNSSNFFNNMKQDEAVVNQRLATKLKLLEGDELLIRIEKINFLPADIPFSSKDNQSIAVRVKIHTITRENEFGRYNLNTSQISPHSIFLKSGFLSKLVELENLSNTMLVEKSELSIKTLNSSIARHWKANDAQLKIRESHEKYEIFSDRVFINDITANAIFKKYPEAQQILSYFVNNIQIDNAKTPYSFVCAPGSPIIPKDLTDNEIIVNQWLADDINAKIGDQITLTYFIPDNSQKLSEDSTTFVIHSIIPIKNEAADKTLAPNFPGLSDSENCRDWDPGIPINLDDIRDKDEQYWNDHQATPKAFVTLSAAQKIWSNRFGNLTSLRIDKDNLSIIKIGQTITNELSPKSFGLFFHPVLEQAMAASAEATDFGELFIGLSFFIIAAALLLTGLLFVLGIEQRKDQTAIMLSMGFLSKQIKNILLIEGILIAVSGGIFGVFGGILYNKVILYMLATIWIDTIGTSSIVMSVKLPALISGGVIGVALALSAMWITVRKQTALTVRELQTNVDILDHNKSKKANLSLIIALISFISVGIILILVDPGKDKSATNVFWGAGFLMLLGCTFLSNWIISRWNRIIPKNITLFNVSIKNITRKKGRSLTTIALLAFGVFVIIGVGANRHDALKNAELKTSGTGGFTFWAETTIPVLQDMNSDKSHRQFGLSDAGINSDFISMRVYKGDDASCLNLNKISKPRILGVNPNRLRGRFSFGAIDNGMDSDGWNNLNKDLGKNIIPAIADMGTIVWSIGKSIGDTITYTNEYGKEIHLKLVAGLAGSMLQGSMIISEDAFIRHFPSNSGSKAFLIDIKDDHEKAMNLLNHSMQDYGLDIITTVEKLAGYQALENTYLSIFLALGGLGLILGTVGIGIVVLRNVLERRNELALLQALGFDLYKINKMVIIENLTLVFTGIICGTFSAIFAVLPAILSPGEKIPYLFIITMIVLIALSGIFWTLTATKLAIKGNLIPALRNE